VAYHEAVKKGGNVPLGLLLGRLHSGRPYLSLPCFSYEYRGRESKKGTEKRKREREKRKRQ
jgi:hypothetical protein